MNKKWLLIAVLLWAGIIQAQTVKHSRKFLKNLDAADVHVRYGNYHLALPVLQELWQQDSSSRDVNFLTGICIFNLKRESAEALPYFEKSVVYFPESNYYLGKLYHNASLFDKALEHYLEFRNTTENIRIPQTDVDLLIDKAQSAKRLVRDPLPVSVSALNNGINTAFSDYAPLISPDGSQLYFTSRRSGSTGNKTDANKEYFEDIYRCALTAGKWTSPVNLGMPPNSETHDAAVALSSDGNTMYFYRTSPDGLSGDIWISDYNNNNWLEAKKMEANINTIGGVETSISISPDGNTIYFSSNRTGGYGGKDLYRVTKMPDGKWSQAMNLGPRINTSQDEDSPFIHPDGRSFYFSSGGHENMGGFDIFKSYLDENGSFTSPVNVGYPINSVRDDIFYVVTHDGKRAFFSSNREGGPGSFDIYQTDIADDDQKNLIMLKGTVTTNEPEFKTLKATITIIDFMTKDLQGIYRTNSSGKYLIVLSPRKKYKVITEAEGYYSHIEEFDLTEKLQLDDLFKSINLKKDVTTLPDTSAVPMNEPE